MAGIDSTAALGRSRHRWAELEVAARFQLLQTGVQPASGSLEWTGLVTQIGDNFSLEKNMTVYILVVRL